MYTKLVNNFCNVSLDCIACVFISEKATLDNGLTCTRFTTLWIHNSLVIDFLRITGSSCILHVYVCMCM